MPKHSRKRKREEDSEVFLLKKIRKLEKKLKHRRRRKYSSSSDSTDNSSRNTTYSEEVSARQEEQGSESMDHYYDMLLSDDDHHQENTLSPFTQDKDSTVNESRDQVQKGTDLTQTDQSITQPQPPAVNDNSVVPADKTLALVEGNESELDKDILDLLGEAPSKDKKYGPNLKAELSTRWYHILTTGLTKEIRKDLIEKYNIPDNCKNIDAPILNLETKAALSESLVKKDKALESKQKQRAAALSSLGEALTRFFSIGFKEISVIKPLLDAGRLICDLQHHDSLIRRSFICSTLKKDVKDQLYNTEIDKYLFSEKLADTLKAAKAIKKSGTEMKIMSQFKNKKAATTSNRNLNSKPPLPNHRPPGVLRKQMPATEPSRRYNPAQSATSASVPSRPRPRSQVQRRR